MKDDSRPITVAVQAAAVNHSRWLISYKQVLNGKRKSPDKIGAGKNKRDEWK